MKKTILLLSGLLLTVCTANAQLKIGDNAGYLNPSAMFEVESATKGVLISRVNLTSATQDIDGVQGQATGLLIYNIGSRMPQGFYYWNGTEWKLIQSSSSDIAQVLSLNCSAATLYPPSYNEGQPYVGVMTVPYSGGNGVNYPTALPITSTGVNGLTASLQAGTLTNGAGNLVYTVTGTPDHSSTSHSASFSLGNLLGVSGCTAIVGGPQHNFAVGETKSVRIVANAHDLFWEGANNVHMWGGSAGNTQIINKQSAYQVVPDSIKAKFITINGLRMDFLESWSENNVRPKLYNTTTKPVTYNISALSTYDSFIKGHALTIAPNAFSFKIDGNDDMGLGQNTEGYTEYVNCMLTFDSGEWYNLTYHAYRDAVNVYLFMTAQRLN